jgi:hypothetical protein
MVIWSDIRTAFCEFVCQDFSLDLSLDGILSTEKQFCLALSSIQSDNESLNHSENTNFRNPLTQLI